MANFCINICLPLLLIHLLYFSSQLLQSSMTRPAPITRLKALRVSFHQIPAFDRFPNTSIQQKPLLIYHSAFHPGTSASSIEAHLVTVGVVNPQWRYTMYSTSHFHSSSHEVLCIASGRAQLCFGGEQNPKRVELMVTEGDVIVVPAGVAHRLMEDLEGGLSMVGSYRKARVGTCAMGGRGKRRKWRGSRHWSGLKETRFMVTVGRLFSAMTMGKERLVVEHINKT